MTRNDAGEPVHVSLKHSHFLRDGVDRSLGQRKIDIIARTYGTVYLRSQTVKTINFDQKK